MGKTYPRCLNKKMSRVPFALPYITHSTSVRKNISNLMKGTLTDIAISVENIDNSSGDKLIEGQDKTTSWVRWLILLLSCITMFGSYYCYDNPSALQSQLQERMKLSDSDFNLFYSVYSYPNIILPLFGGILLNYLGPNIVMLVCILCVLTGQGIFSVAVSTNSYVLALIGRTVFGFGGETLSVASSTLLASWFRGKEVAFAMGINLTISRLGSVVNDNLSPALEKSSSLPAALWFGFFVVVVSTFCTLLVIFMDIWSTKKYGKSALDLEENSFSWKSMKNFSTSYWLITLSCLIVYSAILPFNNNASKFLQKEYGYTKKEAGAVMGIPFIISAVGSPFLGGLVDFVGMRAVLLLISSGLLCMSHAFMAFSDITPYLTLSILGTAYCIYSSAMWPAIAYVVPHEDVGTAYGLTTAVQNAGLAAVPMIVGKLHDDSGGYKKVELFFFILGIFGIAIGIMLNLVDVRNGSVLNLSTIRDMKTITEISFSDEINEPLIDESGYIQGDL